MDRSPYVWHRTWTRDATHQALVRSFCFFLTDNKKLVFKYIFYIFRTQNLGWAFWLTVFACFYLCKLKASLVPVVCASWFLTFLGKCCSCWGYEEKNDISYMLSALTSFVVEHRFFCHQVIIHHVIVLWESKSFWKNNTFRSLLLWMSCWLSVQALHLTSFWCFVWCLLTHFLLYIICTSIKIFKVLYELPENKGKSAAYKVYIYLKPQFPAFQ